MTEVSITDFMIVFSCILGAAVFFGWLLGQKKHNAAMRFIRRIVDMAVGHIPSATSGDDPDAPDAE